MAGPGFRQVDDDLRLCRRELAAQDAAVDRLEAAIDDARSRREAAEAGAYTRSLLSST